MKHLLSIENEDTCSPDYEEVIYYVINDSQLKLLSLLMEDEVFDNNYILKIDDEKWLDISESENKNKNFIFD